jgi:hypothetical protein
MIHYNVWFTLKDEVLEQRGLAVVDGFLRELCAAGEVSAYRLLKNTSDGARTKLPRYHAIIEFADDAALSQAMKNQVARGIHAGGHGEIINVVSEFRVEIFRVFTPEPIGAMLYACEI